MATAANQPGDRARRTGAKTTEETGETPATKPSTRARNRFERQVRNARLRFEHDLRDRRSSLEESVAGRRTRIQDELRSAREDLGRQSSSLGSRVEKIVSTHRIG